MLENYRDRIGGPAALVDAAADHGVAFFDEVVDRHTKTIAFDNVDVALGRGVSIKPADVRRKLLDQGRGGFCFEHAEIIHQALDELGVNHHRFLARVLLSGSQEPGAATHCGNIAHFGGERYLIDPGFGGGTPTVAVPFDGTERAGFRLVPAADDDPRAVDYILQSRTEVSEKHPTGYKDVYGICNWHPKPADLDMACWYAATREGEMFTGNLVVVRRGEGTESIFNAKLKTAQETRELSDPEDLRGALQQHFDIDVDPHQAATLWQFAHQG
ncbi:arylamine N-acetyltransferase family protein [Corynebacterium sp. 32222D000AT]|uniref:arylamine N-acetyltransferase family protein n=1 Tax=unclassified Corynebacterium TaxID=2624378 RepID=UPI002A9A8AF3|nr:arylamine N-acetyltransferase [Mycobacteriaceae bacterium]MDY5829910.1 arylamine N-acetyltransferase [Corynebacterium sp.]